MGAEAYEITPYPRNVLSLAGMTMPTSKSWRRQRQGGWQHRKPLNRQRIKLSTLPLIEIIWKINTFIASFQICIWKSITEFFQMSCLKAVSGPQNRTDRTATWEAPIVSWEHFPNVYTLLEICSKFPTLWTTMPTTALSYCSDVQRSSWISRLCFLPPLPSLPAFFKSIFDFFLPSWNFLLDRRYSFLQLEIIVTVHRCHKVCRLSMYQYMA